MLRVAADTETYILCSSCGKQAVVREIGMAHNGVVQKVAYETHHESIIDQGHGEAQLRAAAFYEKIAAFVAEFNSLPSDSKIVKVDNPQAAGMLSRLDIGSIRPSACNVRRLMIPYFTLKTFGKEYDIQLPQRELSETNLVELLSEASDRAKGIIEEARDRNIMGLD